MKILRDGKPQDVEANTVILALSMRARKDIFDKLAHLAPVSFSVGDCIRPGKIGDAIHDAANNILNLGSVPVW